MPKGVPMTEEHKEKMRLAREAKKKEVASEPKLEDRVAGLEEKINMIADAVLNKPTPSVVLEPGEEIRSVPTEAASFAKKYREVVDRELGPEFRIEPIDGSGVKIYMPEGIDRRDGLEIDAGLSDVSVASPLRAGTEMEDLKIWCKRIKENITKKYPTYFTK